MAESHFDEHEHMNFDKETEKHIFCGKSGKQRSKKEAELQKHEDPNGHTRKLVTKMQNTEKNHNIQEHGPKTSK